MIKQFLMRLAPIALVALPLAACGSTDSDSTTEHGETEKAPEEPHGGRLLTDGPLGIEVTIFENGQEPQFRIYPYWSSAERRVGKECVFTCQSMGDPYH